MKKHARSLAVLLLAALVCQTVSCGGNENGGNTPESTSGSGSGTESSSAETGKTAYPYEVETQEGGKFRILNVQDEFWDGSCHIIDFDEQSGDPYSDALYNRARDTEEKFGLKIEITKLENGNKTLDEMKTQVTAQEDAYDVVYALLRDTMSAGEYVVNLHDIDSLHFNENWWNTDFINQATILGDRLPSTIDYVNMMGYAYGNVLYMNKGLIENNNMDMPYDLIREGKWTYDRMAEYMKPVVSLNGDDSFKASMSGNAVYGFAVQHAEGTMSLQNGSGELLVGKDSDGVPFLKTDVNRLSDVYSKLCSMLSQDGWCVMANTKEISGQKLFEAGRAMFYSGALGIACSDKFRKVNFEYGVVPFPKYDESQEKYYTMASEYTLSLTIPKTVQDTEKVGQVIDYMAFLGRRDVIPELQVKLCYKGLRDDDSIEMFETILGTLSVDVGYIFGWTQEFMKGLCNDMPTGKDRFASRFASSSSKIEGSIEKTISKME